MNIECGETGKSGNVRKTSRQQVAMHVQQANGCKNNTSAFNPSQGRVYTSSNLKYDKFSKADDGSVPLNWLLAKLNDLGETRTPASATRQGTSLKNTYCNPGFANNWGGMLPVNELLVKSTHLDIRTFTHETGID
jgi:hypothetical protein